MSKYLIPFGHQNEMLRAPVPRFDFSNPSVNPAEFAIKLIKIMQEERGIGLSANQVGSQVRCFVMQTDPPMACFNPKVTWESEEQVVLDEACLSFPGVSVKIKRPKHIRARFQDPYGNVITKKFTGLAARVFLHELDHLDGVEFFKRATPIHRDRFNRKWKKFIRNVKRAS